LPESLLPIEKGDFPFREFFRLEASFPFSVRQSSLTLYCGLADYLSDFPEHNTNGSHQFCRLP
jgi:hypothetical protein